VILIMLSRLLVTLSLQQSSIASTGKKSFTGNCTLVIVTKLTNALLDSREDFLFFMSFICEKTSLPYYYR